MIAPRPYALLAEITYRCPLHCPYCSNPPQTRNDQELTTSEWTRVIREAAALGVLQIGFSGGEPLARRDLPEMVRAARAANLYTNPSAQVGCCCENSSSRNPAQSQFRHSPA